MYTIAIISQKGGTGKTSLTINLAIEGERRNKKTVIIDLDPQASAKNWEDIRNKVSPIVISAQASRIDEILNTAKENKADLVFIDTAPHSENASLIAARKADLVLIPCRAGILDIMAINSSVDICLLAKTESFFVLNGIQSRGTLSQEAELALEKYNLKISEVKIGQRIAFVHSLIVGLGVVEYKPNGKASKEIKKLYNWIKKDRF